MTTKFAVLRII